MLSSKRFLSLSRTVPSSFRRLTVGIALVGLVLLGYSLYSVGVLPLPAVLTEFCFAPANAEDSSMPPPFVVMPLSDPRSTQYFSFPGIRQPPTRAAKDAGLAEDAEVIGVCIGGRARAYSLAAMSGGPQAHVVNDMLAGSPVTVAYCNVMGCARVFKGNSPGAPLDLGVGGWQGEKGLIVQLNGVKYALKDGTNLTTPNGSPLPYEWMGYEQTTWGAWHRAYPDTDVYVEPPEQSVPGG